ncbi:MAG: hypothetical protein IJU47_02860 [Verrucomicrobia bacterium]|nr:hypothetical protein [Verrucomicrobiota bacterium]
MKSKLRFMKQVTTYAIVPLLLFFICGCNHSEKEELISNEGKVPISSEGELIVQGMTLDEVNKIFGTPSRKIQKELMEGCIYDISVYFRDNKVVKWEFNHSDYQDKGESSKENLPKLNEILKIGMDFDDVNKLIGEPFGISYDEEMTRCCDYLIYVVFLNGKVEKYVDGESLDKEIKRMNLVEKGSLPPKKYELIKKGMTLEEVNKILGNPVGKNKYNGATYFLYHLSVPADAKNIPLDKISEYEGTVYVYVEDEKVTKCEFFSSSPYPNYNDAQADDLVNSVHDRILIGKLKFKIVPVSKKNEEVLENFQENGIASITEIDGTDLQNNVSFEAMTYDSGEYESGGRIISIDMDTSTSAKVNKFLSKNVGEKVFIICEGKIICDPRINGYGSESFVFPVKEKAAEYLQKKKQPEMKQ